jgi:D-3-phosphoglycerate dehydrogenase
MLHKGNKPKRVLIIDEVSSVLQMGLVEMGIEVDYQPLATKGEIESIIHLYDGIIVRTKMEMNESVLSKATQLTFIGRAGAGLDNIDINYCNLKGIAYFNAGEANADAVGEHTLAMLLSLSTHLQKADKEVRQGIWDRKGNTGWELKGKTVGIIGFGNTGTAVAQKLSGFDVNVLAYDKYRVQYGNSFAKAVSMTDIFEQSDIVSLHVPLTRETMLMVNDEWFNSFKKPIVLLNLSRGKVVRLLSLIDALESGKVKAAGLDVLENEKLKTFSAIEQQCFHNLTQRSNIVFSPHVGGWTDESYEKIGEVLLRKIKELTIW